MSRRFLMNVIIIGGGASGMLAALTAAKNGHAVTLLERQNRVGKKLMATGNGRCNLSNTHANPEHYHGAKREFITPALEQFGTVDAVAFFQNLGLLTVTEESGKIYPYSDQAGSVVDVLRLALDAAHIDVKTSFEVKSLRREKKQFVVSSGDETLRGDRVIVCCGGLAGTKLGGSKSGYELLGNFGHKSTKLYPALVQLKTDGTWVRSLKGVRADTAVKLYHGKTLLAENQGEMQFTEFGVSGPVIFEISRAAAGIGENLRVTIDLMRQMGGKETETLLEQRVKAMPELTMENLLTGMLHNRLGRTVLRYAGYDLTAGIADLTEKDFRKISDAIHSFTLPVIGTLSFESAQVTAGGIRTDEFDSHTLQSRLVPGLYAAGEVLDVDGDCGGYNLQWAWASGHLAGMLGG